MNAKDHWESVYTSKGDAEVSWTQSEPRASLSLIAKASSPPSRVIDVGAGASILAERLLDVGYSVAALDLSRSAMNRAASRLGDRSRRIQWIEADVTDAALTLGTFDVWHDRAVFHFLIDPAHRAAYVALLARTIPLGGHAVIATFALDGPTKCSGLDVRRYDSTSLAQELGNGFELRESFTETHLTPWGKPQSFQYSLMRSVAR